MSASHSAELTAFAAQTLSHAAKHRKFPITKNFLAKQPDRTLGDC